MSEKTTLIKVYESDWRKFAILRAKLEILKNRKVTHADAFHWMIPVIDKELERSERK